MDAIARTRRFTTFVPATPCSEDLRKRLLLAANAQETSLAHVVRNLLNQYLPQLPPTATNPVNPLSDA